MSTAPSFIGLVQRLGLTAEQWNTLKWQLLCELRVAMPAIIKEFDAVKQTVKVQLAIKENLLINSVSTPTKVPELVDVPIVVPRSGGLAITLPIQAGDECLVVFGDMCIDSWWQSGKEENVQMDRRRHDLSDAFAIIGCWSQPRKLSGYSASSLQLRTEDGTTFLEVIAGQVFIKGNLVVDSGATGVFTSQDGKVVTVQNGVVVNIV